MSSLSARLFGLIPAILLAFAFLSGVAGPAAAGVTHPDLKRIQSYLNNVTSMQARFMQASSNGAMASGSLYLSRPGKMRLEYDPPTPVLIVADGTWLIYHDHELNQVSYMPLGSTPADILTRPKIELGGADLVVTDFFTDPGVIQVTLVQADDRDAGQVTLYFSDDPVELRKWSVIDAQGVETQVTLVAPDFGVSLKPELFQFANPKFQKPDF